MFNRHIFRPAAILSMLLGLVTVFAVYSQRLQRNDAISYFYVLITLAMALLVLTRNLSPRDCAFAVVICGLPIMAVASFFTVNSVGHGTQTLAYARNMIVAALVFTVAANYALRQIPETIHWVPYMVILQLVLTIMSVGPILGNMDVIANNGVVSLTAWAIRVGGEGTLHVATLDDSVFVVSNTHVLRIHVPTRTITAKIGLPKLTAEQVGFPHYKLRDRDGNLLEENQVVIRWPPRVLKVGISEGELSFSLTAAVLDGGSVIANGIGIVLSYSVDLTNRTISVTQSRVFGADDFSLEKEPDYMSRVGSLDIHHNNILGSGIRAVLNVRRYPWSQNLCNVWHVAVGDYIVFGGDYGKIHIVQRPE